MEYRDGSTHGLPEFPQDDRLVQLERLFAMRIQHKEQLEQFDLVRRARMALPIPVRILADSTAIPAVYAKPHFAQPHGGPLNTEIGIAFSVPFHYGSAGKTIVAPVYSIVAIEEAGVAYPRPCYTSEEAFAVYGIVQQLRAAKDAGVLPDLSADLLDIAAYEG